MGKSNGYLDEIQGHCDEDMFKEMLRVMAQVVMEEELERHLGAARHERTARRTGHRNGYKPRRFNTRMGTLELEVPQARGTQPYSPLLFAKWQRNERALLVACAEMYFMGVSTRKVKRVLRKMGGFELSASTVSCVAQELDEKLKEFRERRLDIHTWPYLMVDACYVKVRVRGHVVNQAVLTVAGVNDDGRREILTWRMADVESEDTWSEVFRELRSRGVTDVRWVVSDGHEGIRAAVARHYIGASWQRCWTHFMRSALAKVGRRHKDALAKELVAARKFDDVRVCMAESERIARRWETQYPRVARQIREQFEETLRVHKLPPAHRRRIYTTNIMERLMKEIKRRTRVVGIFPNQASADRLVGAHLLERHERWACEPARYLNMERIDTDREHGGGQNHKAA